MVKKSQNLVNVVCERPLTDASSNKMSKNYDCVHQCSEPVANNGPVICNITNVKFRFSIWGLKVRMAYKVPLKISKTRQEI